MSTNSEPNAEVIIGEAIEAASTKFQARKLKECAGICQQILRVDEKNLTALQLLGLVRNQQKKSDEAVTFYQKALEIAPDDYENHNNIALCYSCLCDFDKAIEHLIVASILRPNGHIHLANLAFQFRQKRDFKTAISYYLTAIKQQAKEGNVDPQTWINLAGTYGEIREIDKATECLKKALELDPNNSAAHVDLACVSFLLEDWKTGWSEYEWRFIHYPHVKARAEHFDPNKKWNGEPIADDQTIAVYCEQGIGDMFNFIRFVKPLQKRCSKIKLLIPEDTRPLLASQFPGVCQDSEILDYDLHCSMMSLPNLLELSTDEIKEDSGPYIVPTKKANLETFKDYYKIGISWAGNPRHHRDRQRSCKLSSFHRIHNVPNVKLFSFQKDVRPRVWPGCEPIDLAEGCADMKIVDLAPFINDWTDTAALIAEMDLIITVDTSILHVAGAMGKPTWALISYLPDWRWGLDSQDTMWYRSVKLYRQKRLDDWEQVFNQIADDLTIHALKH